MNRLQTKVSIVTGGALGIGRAIVTRMAQEGAKIAILDVLREEGNALEGELSSQGLAVKYFYCDVAKEAQIASTFNAVADAFGRIDVVVNNAGVSGASKPTHEISESEWDFVQSINVKGVFLAPSIPFHICGKLEGAASSICRPSTDSSAPRMFLLTTHQKAPCG
jgi:NAD(P)-dependent dehydrogenase (short-subunit alcohol dehydrogenase family)